MSYDEWGLVGGGSRGCRRWVGCTRLWCSSDSRRDSSRKKVRKSCFFSNFTAKTRTLSFIRQGEGQRSLRWLRATMATLSSLPASIDLVALHAVLFEDQVCTSARVVSHIVVSHSHSSPQQSFAGAYSLLKPTVAAPTPPPSHSAKDGSQNVSSIRRPQHARSSSLRNIVLQFYNVSERKRSDCGRAHKVLELPL